MGHTPGPWNVEKVHYRHAVVDSAQNGKWDLIAETTSRENANLIAAAPEMLEALEAVVDAMQLNKPVNTFVSKVANAIKKAKGQST